jgi:hypothetical protein
MPELYTNEYIDKIFHIEKTVGYKAKYKQIDDFYYNNKNIIEIQNAAKKLASYAGLSDLTFNIAVASQNEKTAGHIDLNTPGNFVFIEISENVRDFKQAILATLAHEISHKYAKINKLYLAEGEAFKLENEKLTDILSIYLGFGKLMINGSYNSITYQTYSNNQIVNTTKSYVLGYLNISEYIFIYLIINFMRNIDTEEMIRGIKSEDNIGMIKKMLHDNDILFNSLRKDPDYLNQKKSSLEDYISDFQKKMADVENILSYLKNKIISGADDNLKKLHIEMNNFRNNLNIHFNKHEYNNCINILQSYIADDKIVEIKKQLNNKIKIVDNLYKGLFLVIKKYNKLFNNFDLNEENFRTITCSIDGTKMRFKKNGKNISVKCPKCGYQFIVNSTVPDFLINEVNYTKEKQNNFFAKYFKKKK